jgi:very-short-patch-repair endonuclease
MKRKILPYNPHLKELARQLRNNATKSEIRLWQCLKGNKMMGYDFHRQKPIGNYICDFFCIELMLAIEIDGVSHEIASVEKRDAQKDAYFKDIGVDMLRFTDNDIINYLDGTIKAIEDYILNKTQPLQGGERKPSPE